MGAEKCDPQIQLWCMLCDTNTIVDFVDSLLRNGPATFLLCNCFLKSCHIMLMGSIVGALRALQGGAAKLSLQNTYFPL